MTKIPRIDSIEDVKEVEKKPLEFYLKETSCYQVFERAKNNFGNNKAIIDLPTGIVNEQITSYDYQQLYYKITAYINFLNSKINDSNTVISLLLPNSAVSMALLWAAKSIAIANPINFNLPLPILQKIIRNADSGIILFDDKLNDDYRDKVSALIEKFPQINFISLSNIQELESKRLNCQLKLDPNRVCAIYHTSGTTAEPKLVKLTQLNFLYMAWASCCCFNYQSQDNFFLGLPIFHPAANTVALLAFAFIGGTVTIGSPMGWFDQQTLSSFWKTLRQLKITISAALPVVYHQMFSQKFNIDETKSLRLLISGLPLSNGTIYEYEDKLSNNNVIQNIYGLTEATSIVCSKFKFPYQKCYLTKKLENIVNDTGHTVGELIIEGPNVSPGYVGQASQHRLYTQDLAYITHQKPVILDRLQNILYTNDHRAIAPLDAEQRLSNHPLILNLAVIQEKSKNEIHCFVQLINSNVINMDVEKIESDILSFFYNRGISLKKVHMPFSIPINSMGKSDKNKLLKAINS